MKMHISWYDSNGVVCGGQYIFTEYVIKLGYIIIIIIIIVTDLSVSVIVIPGD